jgi:hypothetical protein
LNCDWNPQCAPPLLDDDCHTELTYALPIHDEERDEREMRQSRERERERAGGEWVVHT